jgi:alkylation response protein AidB-like acyl-CoA dehydrogenase
MDFDLSPQEEAFRDGLQAWIGRVFPEGTPASQAETWEERAEAYRRWQRNLFDGGYAGVRYPAEYGGRGGSMMEEIIATELLGHLAVSQGGNLNGIGHGMAGPTIFTCGTEEQKKEFLPKLLDGSHIWCQGFSEPNWGSDVAGITTFAKKEGDHYVVNGQKIWTSTAHIADYCMLLVRTNRDVAKHRGLSYLLMGMRLPGIEVRPIEQITGEAEFNEVFLDDVKIPVNMLVGEEDKGWMIAIATLMFERVMGDLRVANAFLGEFDRMVEMARGMRRGGRSTLEDPLFRQQMAQCYIELMVLKYSGYRSATKLIKGEVPGPEGSTGKLLWSETHKKMGDIAMQIQGPFHQLMGGSPRSVDNGAWQFSFLRSKGNTIEAGTSEILRNIIGERVLGLPKDSARAAVKK